MTITLFDITFVEEEGRNIEYPTHDVFYRDIRVAHIYSNVGGTRMYLIDKIKWKDGNHIWKQCSEYLDKRWQRSKDYKDAAEAKADIREILRCRAAGEDFIKPKKKKEKKK